MRGGERGSSLKGKEQILALESGPHCRRAGLCSEANRK